MEHEERSKELAEYVERWDNGVLEVMIYAGTRKAEEDPIERLNRRFPTSPCYQRVLILPLPPDFNWKKIDHGETLYNSILITEDRVRRKGKGRKNIRPLFAFLDKPGNTSIREVRITGGGMGPRAKVWIDAKIFRRITKRNLYVDKFYADQIFNRGKDNSSL